jgi:hypothetical protein
MNTMQPTRRLFDEAVGLDLRVLRHVAPVSSQNPGCQRSEDVWMMGDGGSTVVIVHSTRTLSVSLNVPPHRVDF